MKKFALITEGITDYLVIKELLFNFFKNDDNEIKVKQMQPLIDETEKQIGFGGWEAVIDYFKSEDLKEMILYNDYVIIQIDTDISENFPLNLSFQNKSDEKICKAMEDKLKGFIIQNNLDLNKFKFAIGLHTIECWLSAIVNPKHKANQTISCIDKVNRFIGKGKKYKVIPPNKKENAKETYTKIASKLKKKKDIIKYSKKNAGFKNFIIQLAELDKTPYNLSCIYSLRKDKENALKYLEKTLSNNEITAEFVQKDEDWKHYFEDVDFIKLIEKYRK